MRQNKTIDLSDFVPVKFSESVLGEFYLFAFEDHYKVSFQDTAVGFLVNITEERARAILTDPPQGRKVNVLFFQGKADHWLSIYSPKLIPVPPQLVEKLREFFKYDFPENRKGITVFSGKEKTLLSALSYIYSPLESYSLN